MASSVAPAPASDLETLLPRPPTPPREAGKDGDGLVKSILSRAPSSDPQDSLQTPPTANTPTSTDAPDSKLMSSRTRKKVVWSAHTEYKDPVDYRSIDKIPRSSPLSVPSPASRPIKGILKPSSSPSRLALTSSGDFDTTSGQRNIIEMLDSTIKQLAGSDRDSKLDAYMMLSRALKASNNLPDRVALQDKMSLFMQFIQRDITSKSGTGAPDSSLINHALTLLATFLHFPAIASTLTSDFGIFVIDHSIRAFEDANTPKDVARHLMQVVAFQNFSSKVMTSDRVGRLVTAMHQIEDHLTGKSIVMSRIHIYRRLVKQSSLHMVTHSDWLQNVLADMLSSVKDIRAQAVGLATEAGFALRSEKQLMRKASEIFQTTNEDQAYIEFYIHRLQEMLRDRSSASAVPQIWSAIILYMRCPLERWQYYGPWLTLVQSAFNTTDFPTKQEANFAWNRYIYLTLVDSKATPKNLGTLCQPLLSQLRRRANPKQLEEAVKLQRTVIGGICNLYYYAFAPGNVKFPPDSIWDVAVQPVLSQLISLDGKPEIPGDCLMQAGRILTSLMDVATPRIWRHDRIMETTPAKPDELPPLDSKWVRRNCDKVFQTVGPLLEKRFLDLANKDSLIFRLWHALVGSIAAASAKDIKVSEDTAKFFAHAFGLLSKMWLAGIPEADNSHGPAFLSSIKNFIEVLVKALGMLPFTEKRLAMTVGNTFEPIATPSQNQSRPSSLGTIRTPLQHLFCLLASVPLGGADDEALSDFFLSVFEPFFLGKATKARLELSNELLQLLPRASPSTYGPWLLGAQNLSLSLENSEAASSLNGSGKMLGLKYRDITSLLERGLFGHPHLPLDRWFALFEQLSENVVRQLGDAGRALAVIEPLAKELLDCLDRGEEKPSATSLKAIRSLFDAAKLPRDKTALNTARQRLWGASVVAARAGSSDPFDNLYKLGNQALETFYGNFAIFDADNDIVPCIESIKSFLIKFTLVASSSPIPGDDSQHLTERQKEVRERQRETEAIYSDMRTSSPPPAKESSPIADEKVDSTDKQAEEATPRHATSYDNLISSTPTPRRGQLLNMDDNDPPSSPPIPRPYPLLSEIKSRSMAGSSLDSWEFSSPPGSPDPGDQEALLDIQLPGEKSTKRSTGKADTRAKSIDASLRDVIPSSLGEEESSSSDLTELSDRNASSSPDPPPQLLETPTKKRLVREAARVEDSPKSVDDEFVDARSSPEKPSLVQVNDTSFALSEGDETRMMKLAEELESGDRAGLQEERNAEDTLDERPSVQSAETRAPSPPMTRGAAKRSPSVIIPPISTESLGNGEGGSKRKRKRGGSRQSNSRSKKQKSEQKSENVEEAKEGEVLVVTEKETPETPSVGVETRGSARRQSEQRQREDKSSRSQRRSSKRNKKVRSEETDDEVMSQLVNESQAVTESQKSNKDAEEEVSGTDDGPRQPTERVDVKATAEDKVEDKAESEPQAKILTIMETLQTSLAHLRDVALPRSEVYKMEDMLMDLKRELFEAERRGREST
ncbi:telomere length regulator protein rif1 [Trichoderma asperellum]|uniref:Telomere length regulator protein rif1 n=1 Tax=Trichoderma asperellum TaxID=101201 RepID=A0A6V8R4I9_TRIAP|nr:telomere length regulator protein rif1 [Trichoderma asperellum]